MRIKKGDNVIVLRGKDKGKKSKVLRGFPNTLQVLVEKVNMKKMHKRPKRQGEKGQVVEVVSPISVSKLKLICPKCNKPTRVGFNISETGKTRVCRKCGEEI